MQRACLGFFLSIAIYGCVLAPAAKAAKPEAWLEVRSPHFTVISDAGEKQARRVAFRFEQIRMVFHKTFPRMSVDPIAPIVVIAVKSQDDFDRLEPAAWDQKGALQRSGLFQKTPETNYVLVNVSAPGANPYHTLFHEYTHLLVHQNVGHIPLWLDEGLAEFYGYTQIHSKEIWLGSPSTSHILLLRRAPLISLPVLFRVGYNSPYYNEQDKGNMFYAESWALTHMLMLRDFRENKDQITAYMNAVRQGADSVDAAEQVFGSLTILRIELAKYVQQQTFDFLRLKVSTRVDEQGFSSTTLTAAQTDAQFGDLLVYERRYKEAQTLLADAIRLDPSDAAPVVSMGFLEFQQNNAAAAEKWFTRAVSLNSNNYLANYYYAVMVMHEGRAAAAAPRVEQSLKTAIQINPRFAPAYATLANLYLMRGQKLATAHRLVLHALTLDPTNIQYYQIAAGVLIGMKDPANAIRVCQEAEKLAKTPAQLAAVETEIESAERYQNYLDQEKQRQQAMLAARKAEAEAASAKSSSDVTTSEMQPPAPVHRPRVLGPREVSAGVIKSVVCPSGGILNMDFDTNHQTLRLHTDNYYHLVFRALNFTPHGVLNPCLQIAGMRARIAFYEVKGHPDEGDLISIGLEK